MNNTDLSGKLVELGMYDVLVEVTESKEVAKGMFKDVARKIIVQKGAIVTIEVV